MNNSSYPVFFISFISSYLSMAQTHLYHRCWFLWLLTYKILDVLFHLWCLKLDICSWNVDSSIHGTHVCCLSALLTREQCFFLLLLFLFPLQSWYTAFSVQNTFLRTCVVVKLHHLQYIIPKKTMGETQYLKPVILIQAALKVKVKVKNEHDSVMKIIVQDCHWLCQPSQLYV